MNLNKYLETFFPDLKLQKPLVYNWQNSLRFEVGSESIPAMKKPRGQSVPRRRNN